MIVALHFGRLLPDLKDIFSVSLVMLQMYAYWVTKKADFSGHAKFTYRIASYRACEYYYFTLLSSEDFNFKEGITTVAAHLRAALF